MGFTRPQAVSGLIVLCFLAVPEPVPAVATYTVKGAVQDYEYVQSKQTCPNGSDGYCQYIITQGGKFAIVGQPTHPSCSSSQFRYDAADGGLAEFAGPLIESISGPGWGGGSVGPDQFSQMIASAVKNKHLLQVTYYEAASGPCDSGVGYYEVVDVRELNEDARTVDLNANNFRDDVEAYVNRVYKGNPSLKAIVEQEARAQLDITTNYTNFSTVLAKFQSLAYQHACHANLTGIRQAEIDADNLMSEILYNTALFSRWAAAINAMPEPGATVVKCP